VASLQQEKIQSLIIPLRHNNMVLPQTSIAEVISVPEVKELHGEQPWFTGHFNWRNQQVPLISIERMCGIGNQDPINRARRLAVLYGLEKHPGLEFYAIEIQAIPHPVLLGNEDLVAIDEVTDDSGIIDAHVQAIGIKSFIPNLVTIEDQLKQLLEKI